MRAKRIKRIGVKVVLAGLLMFVLWFPNIQGEVLSQMNEALNRQVLQVFGSDHYLVRFMDDDRRAVVYDSDFAARLPENYGYALRLEKMNRWMEDGIHSIQYFVFTVGCLMLISHRKISFWKRMALVALIAVALSYFSEMMQNAVSGRGYETKDVIHNLWGIGIGLVIYWLGANRKKRSRPQKGETDRQVIVKRLSGADFFDRTL